MTLYVTEISKYIIAVLAALFAGSGFLTLHYKSEKRRTPIYIFQTVILFSIEGFAFLQIVMRTGELKYLLYAIFITLLLASLLLLFKAFFPDSNRLILNHMAFLLMTSMIVLLRIDEAKAIRQIIIATVSIIVMFIVCEVVYKKTVLAKITWVYAIAGVLLLGIVRVLGSITNGSYLSISIGGLTFQPSEFAKILLIFFLACALCESSTWKEVLISASVTILYMMILLLSKDLGASAILFMIFLSVVFIATRNPAYLLGGAIMGILGSIAAYLLFSHVQVRVQAWLDPWSSIDSGGYQLTQSLFGISSGGWFGLGLFSGNPQTIPYVEDDFIFSAIAEELGIIYAVSMVAVALGIFLMILLEAARLRDNWSKLIDGGIAVSFIFQTFLTVGGGTKFIPLTGVTLPLVSYGGSSLMATIIMLGVFQATCIIRADEHYDALEQHRQMLEEQRRKKANYQKNTYRQNDYRNA